MSVIETKYRGRVVTVNVENVLLPNGERADYEIIHHPGGAAIVALNAQEQVCLLHQFRPAAGGWVWELPAGRLEPDEPPAATASRELLEEAGCTADSWQELGVIWSSPGVFAERIHLFLASNLHLGESKPERYEVFEVHWVPFDVAVAKAVSGEIADAKSIVGLLRARARWLPTHA
jgi:8-oxo-dGTP pyrophosphatase MutT (NUDIX family)